jgi:thiol-disulfide isomerase/thioredoxin
MLDNMSNSFQNMIPTLPSSMNLIGGANLNWTTAIVVFVLFLIIGVLYYVYYFLPSISSDYLPNSEVGNGGQSSGGGGGGGRGNGNNVEIFLFSANWCPHCKTAKPIFETVESEYDGKQVNGRYIVFTKIDCTEETPEVDALMKKYNVEGYPTIKMLKDGKIIDFDAKPTKENLNKFIMTFV